MDLNLSLGKTTYEASASIGKILEGKFSHRDCPSLSNHNLWGAQSYQLEKSSLFNSLNQEKQDTILSKLAFSRLEEAYHIEHYGMTFASKMSLFAKSFQEQQLYCVVASEEAEHLQMVNTLIGDKKSKIETNDFSNFLKNIIAVSDRETLIFVIQILLEGWGLDHYKIMADTSLDENVKNIFSQIVIDESAHHGSGLVLFNEKDLSEQQIIKIVDIMKHFIDVIKIGPVGLINVMDTETGGMTKTQLNEFLTNIEAKNETQRKLNLIKKLITHAKADKILSRLDF